MSFVNSPSRSVFQSPIVQHQFEALARQKPTLFGIQPGQTTRIDLYGSDITEPPVPTTMDKFVLAWNLLGHGFTRHPLANFTLHPLANLRAAAGALGSSRWRLGEKIRETASVVIAHNKKVSLSGFHSSSSYVATSPPKRYVVKNTGN